jgi:sugar phosphate isomerase/epimerase
MQTTRRQFIQSSLGCAIGMSLSHSFSALAASEKRIPIAFQLYTVRGEFEKDAPDTLKTLAYLGYKAVEFWGYDGGPKVYQEYTAPQLRGMLDDHGLKCCGMHLQLKALEKENFKRTLETNHVLSSEFLNVASAQDKMGAENKIAELADFLNHASEECKKHKKFVGYHSHPFDFAKISGRYAWEILFDKLRPEVNMQLDVGNCLDGGGDPIAVLKEFPGRTRSIHIKEHEDKTFDSDFYTQVFQLCETTEKLKWYIVEMGSPDGTGFEIPQEAMLKLRKLGKAGSAGKTGKAHKGKKAKAADAANATNAANTGNAGTTNK